jgi:LacI family transcriptional regulator
MANIQDVANAAGVSTASVSRYLAGQPVRAAGSIRKAIADLDYSPSALARSLKSGRHGSIGVVVPDIMNPFFANLVRGIEAEARTLGYQVILANSDESAQQEESQVQALIQRTDGLIIAPIMEEDLSVLSLSHTGIPVVLVDRDVTTASYDRVLVDNLSGIKQAIDHLVSLGHTDIAFISGPLSSTPGRARHSGYLSSMAEHGLRHRPEYVVLSDFREDGGYDSMRELWALSRRPTAVVIANNLMTIGALKALNELSIQIPAAISIIGFDDLSFANLLNPPLTVISRDAKDQGAQAAGLLFERIAGTRTAPGQATTLPVNLIIRRSTSTPPAKNHS